MTDHRQDDTSPPPQRREPTKTPSAILIALGGLWLLFGATYQLTMSKWFPLFPVQIDGLIGIFDWLFGRGTGIYVSSILAGLLGGTLLGLSIIGFKTSGPGNSTRPGELDEP